MEIPLAVIQGLNCYKAKKVIEVETDSTSAWNLDQHNKSEDFCPIGCDSTRTKLTINKTGKKDSGNFVKVYYRGSSKLVTEIPLEVKQAAFWREVDELIERKQRSGRNRSQPVRSSNSGNQGNLRT